MTRLIAPIETNSDKSTNRQLLSHIAKHFADKADIELMEIKDTPLFNKGLMHSTPTSVQEKETEITAVDGVITVMPGYNHSVLAALQNILEWLSVGQRPFVGKLIMIIGTPYGTLGSPHAQAQLRQILDAPELCVYIMPNSEYHLAHPLQTFDENGVLKDSEQVRRLEALLTDLLVFIKITSQLTKARAQYREEVETFSWEELEQ